MDPIVAMCGNRCDLCPLYGENFEKLGAEKVNAGFYKYYQGGAGDPPHYGRCDGCSGDGCVARPDCPIRACATARSLSTCARCPDLFCRLLESDMQAVEGAARNYAGLADDFEIFIKPFLTRARLSEMRARS